MIEIDPHDRIDLAGPWAGFGFQGGHLFTPDGHQLESCDMAWLSLTCNIAREWRLLMAEARAGMANRPVPAAVVHVSAKSSVIYLAEALRIRQERRFGMGESYPGADDTNVVEFRPGPR
ncbi:DUF3653 domain-containing protein [Stenotrophomonas pavanii]|uniref:DUF3653 domain-containing protein n=1 Tax=Stenotrophomonas pavanii TaxID=487698 RepID=UPI0007090775|nr:DUF3653 domain-containing protein [Stenotrophomonas pavanii]